MFTRFPRLSSLALVGLLSVFSACKPAAQDNAANGTAASDEHEHARPANLAEGVAQIKTNLKAVEDAFANNKPEDCDGALHELAEILEVVPEVAAESKLPQEAQDEVKKASGGLMDALMKIHEGFHGDAKGSSYSDVKSAIDENLAVLEAKAAETP